MSDEDEQEPSIIYRAELTDPTVSQVDIELTLTELWEVYEAIHTGGFASARKVVSFAGRIMQSLIDAHVTDEGQSFNEVWEDFGAVFGLHDRQWTTDMDLKRSFCYYLLLDGLINRTEAAELGRSLIELSTDPVTPTEVDAFRKRLDRWAERHSLPRPGRPRKQAVSA